MATMDSKWPVVPNDDPHPHRSPPNGRPAVWCRGDDRVTASVYYIRCEFEKCLPRIALFFVTSVNSAAEPCFVNCSRHTHPST